MMGSWDSLPRLYWDDDRPEPVHARSASVEMRTARIDPEIAYRAAEARGRSGGWEPGSANSFADFCALCDYENALEALEAQGN